MSIKIKLHQGNWRLIIGDEEWQFLNRKELDIVLKTLLDYKEKYGKLNLELLYKK